MDAREYNKLPDAQRKALRNLYERSTDGAKYYTDFIARAHNCTHYIMIPWCGMTIGIEPDGYTHS